MVSVPIVMVAMMVTVVIDRLVVMVVTMVIGLW